MTLQLYNPSTGTTTTDRSAYDNNQLTNLDPVAAAAQNTFYPHANNTVGSYDPCTHANNFYADPKLISNERTALGRVDYQLSEKDSLAARYVYYLNYTNNGNQGLSPLFYRNDTLKNQNAMLSETHTFSPTLVNDASNRSIAFRFSIRGCNSKSELCWPVGAAETTHPSSAPIFNNSVVTLNGTVGFRASTTLELLDDVTKTIGNHTVHIGFDGRFRRGL